MTSVINFDLLAELRARGEHPHQRGAQPDVEYPNVGVAEVLDEAVACQHLLDLAGIPNDKGYEGDVDARTYLLVVKASSFADRLARIASWHSRETGPGGMVGDFCNECGNKWPCDTRRMVDGTYVDDETILDEEAVMAPSTSTAGWSHGYTRHGHSCCDLATGPRPNLVARCGGPGLCGECSADVVVKHMPGSGRFDRGESPPSTHPLRERLGKIFACRCDPAWTDRRLHAPDCVEDLGEDAADEVAAWLRDVADEMAAAGHILFVGDLPNPTGHAAATLHRLADQLDDGGQ